jgi:thiol-disulfide isomerase/thioredoxin
MLQASWPLPRLKAQLTCYVTRKWPILCPATRQSAPWCPTCKAQAPILNELRAEPRFKELQVFSVDFDSQKDALRTFRAQRQSTLIVFKGATEVGRSVGDTDKASIAALLAKSL